MAGAEVILQLKRVSKSYEAPGGGEPIAVLRNVSLEVARGESVALVGPSGSGKSTLLQIIAALDRPTSGTVSLEGQDLNSLPEDQAAAVRNGRLGFVFQAHYLLPQCSVLENVLLPTLGKASRRAGPQEVARAQQLLKRVGLGDRLTHRPAELSGGEQQRTAVARALMNEPVLLLADEPTGSLDHHSAAGITELLSDLNQREHLTLIVATHTPDLARQMGKVLELKDGTLAPRTFKMP